MAAATIGSGLAFVLVALSVPQPVDHAALVLDDHRFDLAATTLAQPPAAIETVPEQRLAKPLHSHAMLVGARWTPPSKTWGSMASGPVIQVGALGSKDKRIPDLAHVALDWIF